MPACRPGARGPSSTSRRASAICADEVVVDQRIVGDRPRRQVHRLGPRRRRRRTTRSCHTRSVMNGVIGAISLVSTLERVVQRARARPGRRSRTGAATGARTSWTGRRRTARCSWPARWVSKRVHRDGRRRERGVWSRRSATGRAPAARPRRPGRAEASIRRSRAYRTWNAPCSSTSAAPCGRPPGSRCDRFGGPTTASLTAA